MPLLVVRHAHAVARATWEGDNDGERPLSPKGRQQAELLAGVLSGYQPLRILSSPATRCCDTVAPLSTLTGVPVEVDGCLAEGAPEAAVKLARSLAGTHTVLCSHGDIIPALLEALAAKDKVHLGKHPRVEKASVWVLDGGPDRFKSARYLAPPKV